MKINKNNKIAINFHLLITTVNVNKFCAPVKKHMVTEWVIQQDLYICHPKETHFRSNDPHRLKLRDKKDILCNANKQKSGLAIYKRQQRN